jgi:hypothetical protein
MEIRIKGFKKDLIKLIPSLESWFINEDDDLTLAMVDLSTPESSDPNDVITLPSIQCYIRMVSKIGVNPCQVRPSMYHYDLGILAPYVPKDEVSETTMGEVAVDCPKRYNMKLSDLMENGVMIIRSSDRPELNVQKIRDSEPSSSGLRDTNEKWDPLKVPMARSFYLNLIKKQGVESVKSHAMTWKYEEGSKQAFPRICVYILTKPEDFVKTEPPGLSDAVWDSGAIISCISQRKVRELNLHPVGEDWIETITGQRLKVNTYNVTVYLDDDFYIQIHSIKETPSHTFDLWLGMDVIDRGDFAITRSSGKRVVSFKIPSTSTIDFT